MNELEDEVDSGKQTPENLAEFFDKWQSVLTIDAELNFSDAWLQLADEMMQEIHKLDAIAVKSIVSDFGQLECETVIAGFGSEDHDNAILVTERYRKRSKKICESCGKHSLRLTRKIDDGLVRCLCRDCRANNKTNSSSTGTWLDQF